MAMANTRFFTARQNLVFVEHETLLRPRQGWATVRREPRRKLTVRVVVAGTDLSGRSFEQETETVDVSQSGACVRLAQPMAIPSPLTVSVPDYGWRGEAIVRTIARDEQGYLTGIEIIGQAPHW